MVMRVYLGIMVALAAWAVAILKFNAVRRNVRRTRDQRVFGLWLFSLCFALSLTHLIRPFHVCFDAFFGLNNLSWLMAYVYLALGIYFLSFAGWLLHQCESRHWPLLVLICTLGLLLALFVTGICRSPEWPDHNAPRNDFDLLFMVVFYLYAIIVGAVPVSGLYKTYRREQSISTRLRFFVGFLAGVMAISFFVAKSAYILYAYFYPASGILQYLLALSMFFMGTSGLLAVAAFLPGGLYRDIPEALFLWRRLMALRDLKVVEDRLNCLCPPVVVDDSTWWERVRNINFFTYRSVIAILDGQRTLSAVLLSVGPSPWSGQDRRPQGQTPVRAPGGEWDEGVLREAIYVRDSLQGAMEERDFEGLVAFYRDAGRRLQARGRLCAEEDATWRLLLL